MQQADISIHAFRGEGDSGGMTSQRPAVDFNPRPPWGGRPAAQLIARINRNISIHALRGEGDHTLPSSWKPLKGHFNPRPPWGGRRPVRRQLYNLYQFQSTPSVGRATKKHIQNYIITAYFNPRPPWGGRHQSFTRHWTVTAFQSTPSVGRATIC